MNRNELPSNTYGLVLSDWRTVFVVTPKAGCTSLLWTMAAIQGEDVGLFQRSLLGEVSRALTVHDKSSWHRTRILTQLSDKELAAVSPEDGWFTFCVTRHPLPRIWSAWRDKLLLREPLYVERFGSEDWFPRVPHDADAVAEDFERFVAALKDRNNLLNEDTHWMPQTNVLNVASMRYTHVGKVEEITATLDALKAHLVAQGWTAHLPRLHEHRRLLPLSADLLRPGVVETIEDLYRSDYERFGYDSGVHCLRGKSEDGASNIVGPPGEQLLEALRHIIGRHERIGDLEGMIHEATAKAHAARQARVEMSQETRATTEKLIETEKRLHDLKVELETCQRTLELIERSRTFRYSEMLRKVYAIARRRMGLTDF